MTKKKINELVNKVVKSGNWMIRSDDNGKSYDGFQWKPVGVWTKAPDWRDDDSCGGGLHGQGPEASGFGGSGKRLVFCETKGKRNIIDGNKIKVPEARILLINKLPKSLRVDGTLDLINTEIQILPKDLKVGRDLDLSYSNIQMLPENLQVYGNLDLSNTNIRELPKGLQVGGNLDLNNTEIQILPKDLQVSGNLYLYSTKIQKLPKGLQVGDKIFGI